VWPGMRLALVREWIAHVGFVVVVVVVVAAAADAGCLILRRALATRTRLRADPLDLLRIAARHFRNFRRNWQCFAQPRLRGPLASFANRQRDLVAGSSVVGRSAENVPCHQQQRRVVIALGKSPGRCPDTSFSTSRTVRPRDASSQSRSVARVATRVSSRTLDQLTFPSRSAAAS
jgi:hypothetical protein